MEKYKHFYELLPINNIVCASTVSGRDELLNELLNMLKRHHPALDLESAAREVTAREELFPTVIAPGLAVPHARMPGMESPLLGMICTPAGVDFKSELGPVRVTILLLSPVDDPNLHLRIIAELAKTFGAPGVVDSVVNCRTPGEVLGVFTANRQERCTYLTADDLMETPPAILRETDTLAEAIRDFATTKCGELVVLDGEGDLRGVLALTDLLKYSLPEHLLWMDDLSPIDRFQPFAEMLKTADDTKVADVMRSDFLSVEKTVPAIQLAKLFTMHRLRQLVITDGGRFAGVVELKNFCAKLFWE